MMWIWIGLALVALWAAAVGFDRWAGHRQRQAQEMKQRALERQQEYKRRRRAK